MVIMLARLGWKQDLVVNLWWYEDMKAPRLAPQFGIRANGEWQCHKLSLDTGYEKKGLGAPM